MVVRCTGKLLNLLGGQSVALVDSPPSTDDWYANLLWVDQRKCLLVAHAGTLFTLFVADIRVNDLRPFERRIVELLTGALLEEGLSSDALGRLEPNEVRLAKTASRHVLGVMNQMALEIGWHVDPVGGLWNIDVDGLNRHLRRSPPHQRRRLPRTARTRARGTTAPGPVRSPRLSRLRSEFPAPTGSARTGSRPRPRDGAVHRHRRLDAARV